METKEFSLASVLSLTTGRMLCNFSDMHELAEFVAGHPIWSHEFADRQRVDALRDSLLSQYPELATVDASAANKDNYQAMLDGWIQQFGPTRQITKGSLERKENPLESLNRLMPGKPVLAVAVNHDAG